MSLREREKIQEMLYVGGNGMPICKECGNDHGKIHLSGEIQEGVYCPDCFNEMIAADMDLKLEKYLDSISVQDGQGINRIFTIEKIVMPGFVSIEATEAKKDGYKFSVLGEFHCDQKKLFQKLVEKVKRGIANTYVKEEITMNGQRFLTMIGDEIIGRIDWNENAETPMLNIDGKPYTWEEIGKMMMSNEGFQFRLEILDVSEEF